jgi:hypothetical protein
MKLDSWEHLSEEWRLIKVYYGNDTGLVSIRSGTLVVATWDTSCVSMPAGIPEVTVEECDLQKLFGDDQKQMQGYQDRLEIREVLGSRLAREIVLEPKM